MGRFEHVSIPAARVISSIAKAELRRAQDSAGNATEAERIREGICRAELTARIAAARIGLHDVEILGDWGFIERRHRRLRDLEIKLWLRGCNA